MTNDLAPIALSTYSRLSHLKQTVRTLQQNTLASNSDLYILSDAPRKGDEEKVQAVRKYIHTINGFKNVHIIERKLNNRVENNRGGMRMLLEKYGKIVFLEEDVSTAPNFLAYMNQALNTYEKNDHVFSITGYCPPISMPKQYMYDGYFLRRFNAWGFGIWKDRFEKIQYISNDKLNDLLFDKSRTVDFCSYGGDMLDMLKAEANGDIDALDVKAMFAQFVSNQYTLYPTESLTANHGFDGSGMHCGKTSKFDVSLSHKSVFNLPESLVLNDVIIKANYDFRRPSMMAKVKTFIKKHLLSS